MKVAVYASMFGGDDPPTLESVESYIDYAAELKVEVIDMKGRRGFASDEHDYLFGLKMRCLRAGLSVGYVASGGPLVGTEEEVEAKVGTDKSRRGGRILVGRPADPRVLWQNA